MAAGSCCLANPDAARPAVAEMRFGYPSMTWRVVRRTTTVTEGFADEFLDDADHKPGSFSG